MAAKRPGYHQLERGVTLSASPEFAFTYARLEAAIASLHAVGSDALKKAFRSRIRNFQKIGIVPSSPGKGQKLEYKLVDAVTWALCFELAELGLPPDQIRSVIRLCGFQLFGSFAGPIQDEDQIFVLAGNFLEWHLNPGPGIAGEGATMHGVVALSELNKNLFKKPKWKWPRVLMINLTDVKRKLGAALEIQWH